MPDWAFFVISGGDEGILSALHACWETVTARLRLRLSRLLVFEPLGSHNTYVRHKFTRHKGRVNLWRCSNILRQTPYNKIQGLTGIFRVFSSPGYGVRTAFPPLLQNPR